MFIEDMDDIDDMEFLPNENLSKKENDEIHNDVRKKIKLMNFQEKQNRELINLQNENCSVIEEENLRKLHRKQEKEFLNKQISDDLQIKDEKRLQRLKELEYIDIISSEDVELLFGITVRSQATYRKRSKKRLPFIGGGKGGSISYSKQSVNEWLTKQ